MKSSDLRFFSGVGFAALVAGGIVGFLREHRHKVNAVPVIANAILFIRRYGENDVGKSQNSPLTIRAMQHYCIEPLARGRPVAVVEKTLLVVLRIGSAESRIAHNAGGLVHVRNGKAHRATSNLNVELTRLVWNGLRGNSREPANQIPQCGVNVGAPRVWHKVVGLLIWQVFAIPDRLGVFTTKKIEYSA